MKQLASFRIEQEFTSGSPTLQDDDEGIHYYAAMRMSIGIGDTFVSAGKAWISELRVNGNQYAATLEVQYGDEIKVQQTPDGYEVVKVDNDPDE